MSDEVFLQDCIDICQGDLDDTYCAGFSIIPGLRCFFYGEGVKYDRQGKWPAWTFYEKVKRGPTDCDFTNRRKCVDEQDDDGEKPKGTKMTRTECRDKCIAEGQGCCQYNDKTEGAAFGWKTTTGSPTWTMRTT